ncbi:hypothetical protein [Sphingobacterium hotanense]|uniref:hypothetical protein n=1 Tax=Sphingobacterium hotanense TaxID=649196 RepID=UPI0021A5CD55|nr:hypothetical protein [Sphingobacterium hotanense]MCT1526939.1 hypothetical protein [Sphingobacterium hotanense]
MAFQPQIIQSFTIGNLERNKKLILTTSKYSFFMLAIISAPIIYYCHAVLIIWLGDELPQYVERFVQFVLLCSIFDALAGPFWMSATAIGNIRSYNIVLTVINLATLPIAYLILKLGYGPVYAFSAKIFTYSLMQIFRYYFINKQLRFDNKEFQRYFFQISAILIIIVGLAWFSNIEGKPTYLQLLTGTITIELLLLSVMFVFGLQQYERVLMYNFLKKRFLN